MAVLDCNLLDVKHRWLVIIREACIKEEHGLACLLATQADLPCPCRLAWTLPEISNELQPTNSR